ncbi:MAG TPA: hypothetical protein VGP38_11305, partial [Rubrobacter sp.]|nr:hypothetical protein [Rubrobacter sp.]
MSVQPTHGLDLGEQWLGAQKRYEIEAARAREYYGRKPNGVWRPRVGNTDFAGPDSDFQRYGKYYIKMLSLDACLQEKLDDRVVRGAAKGARPDEEVRRKIRLFKRVQAGREDAYEALGKDLGRDRDDAPARLALGGLQDFTAGRENGDEVKKDPHKRPKGYAPWRPHKKTVKLIAQVQEVLEEYRAHLPMT